MKNFVAVVEDDPLLRSVLADLIKDLGAECLDFETSDDALVYLLKAEEPISLVIIDQETPGQLRGNDLACMIKQRWPERETVVMSGHEALAIDNLPSDIRFIQKPLCATDLLELVTAALA